MSTSVDRRHIHPERKTWRRTWKASLPRRILPQGLLDRRDHDPSWGMISLQLLHSRSCPTSSGRQLSLPGSADPGMFGFLDDGLSGCGRGSGREPKRISPSGSPLPSPTPPEASESTRRHRILPGSHIPWGWPVRTDTWHLAGLREEKGWGRAKGGGSIGQDRHLTRDSRTQIRPRQPDSSVAAVRNDQLS